MEYLVQPDKLSTMSVVCDDVKVYADGVGFFDKDSKLVYFAPNAHTKYVVRADSCHIKGK